MAYIYRWCFTRKLSWANAPMWLLFDDKSCKTKGVGWWRMRFYVMPQNANGISLSNIWWNVRHRISHIHLRKCENAMILVFLFMDPITVLPNRCHTAYSSIAESFSYFICRSYCIDYITTESNKTKTFHFDGCEYRFGNISWFYFMHIPTSIPVLSHFIEYNFEEKKNK